MKLFLFVFAVVATFSAISALEEMGELEEFGECSLCIYSLLFDYNIEEIGHSCIILPLTFDSDFFKIVFAQF